MDKSGPTSWDTKRAWTQVESLLQKQQQQQPNDPHFAESILSQAAAAKAAGKAHMYTEQGMLHNEHDGKSILDMDLLESSMKSIEQLLALEHFVAIEQRLAAQITPKNLKP